MPSLNRPGQAMTPEQRAAEESANPFSVKNVGTIAQQAAANPDDLMLKRRAADQARWNSMTPDQRNQYQFEQSQKPLSPELAAFREKVEKARKESQATSGKPAGYFSPEQTAMREKMQAARARQASFGKPAMARPGLPPGAGGAAPPVMPGGTIGSSPGGPMLPGSDVPFGAGGPNPAMMGTKPTYSAAGMTPGFKGPAVDTGFAKGGKVKSYAKGGVVKGAGCEQRGLRKCKVY